MTAKLKKLNLDTPVAVETTYELSNYQKELCHHWAKQVVAALMQDEKLTAMLTDVIKQHLNADE